MWKGKSAKLFVALAGGAVGVGAVLLSPEQFETIVQSVVTALTAFGVWRVPNAAVDS